MLVDHYFELYVLFLYILVEKKKPKQIRYVLVSNVNTMVISIKDIIRNINCIHSNKRKF